MQRVRVNGDIKDDNERNEKIQVPQARALRAHKGREIAALHVDIAIYLQGRERREQQAGCLGAEPRCICIVEMELDSFRSFTYRKLERRLLLDDFRCRNDERLRHTKIEI